jgi:hypothetical protein
MVQRIPLGLVASPIPMWPYVAAAAPVADDANETLDEG